MQGAMAGGKLKVRGAFQAECYGLLRAISVNLGRIARYFADPESEESLETLAQAFFVSFIYVVYLYYLYCYCYSCKLQSRRFSYDKCPKFPS
jgi:hypothetical protein